MTAQELAKQNDKLKEIRSMIWSVWVEINNYISPRYGTTLLKMSPGVKQTANIFDSTAIACNEDLAAWLHSNLTSMGMEWFSLKMAGRDTEGVDKDAMEWLEECKQREYDAFAASNFQGQIQQFYLDLPSFCTACLYLEEAETNEPGFGGFQFKTLAPGEYSFALGPDGKACALFREFELEAQIAFDKWGSNVSQKVKDMLDAKPMEKLTFLHAVFPRGWYGGGHKTGKEYASYYVELDSKKIMTQGGYEEFPYFVVPWLRSSGEIYGRGPGWTALPDIKSLNKAKDLGFAEWSLSFRPPLLQRSRGVLGSIRLTPGGLTTVENTEKDLKQFITQARFSDNRIKEEDLKTSIREIFHYDKVKYLPPREETGQMTAYETARRYQLMQMLLGPSAYGNLATHLFDPMIERGFYMMMRKGMFSRPPDSIVQMARSGREHFKVEYEGPLAKAQRSSEIEAIDSAIMEIGNMAQLFPDITDNFDSDEAAQHIGRVRGVPAKIMRSKEEIQKIRTARGQAALQQRALEQTDIASGAAQKLAGAAKSMGPGGMNAMARAAGQV